MKKSNDLIDDIDLDRTILRLFFESLLTAPRSQVFNPLKI